jgi:hypothetical protein
LCDRIEIAPFGNNPNFKNKTPKLH